MIVIDSSAMVEALIGREADDELLDSLETSVHAPHLLDVEVVSVLRGLTQAGKLAPMSAEQALTNYYALTIARYELAGLTERVWALRGNVTTYEACYLALAETLHAPLYTCDRTLANDGHDAALRLLARSR